MNLIAAILLVAAHAFFVAAEHALLALRRREPGSTGAAKTGSWRSVERAQRDLERTVSGAGLGATLSALGLGWVGGAAVARRLAAAFAGTPPPWSGFLTTGVAVVVALFLIAAVYLVLGVVVPRLVAFRRPEAVAAVAAPPLRAFTILFSPVLWLLNRVAAPLVRSAGGVEASAWGAVQGTEEIEQLLRRSREVGVVEEDEEEMIHGVFELTRTVAREVMTPRPDIVAVSHGASLDEVLDVAAESGFSRFPVYRESIDDVIGIVLVKDLIRWLRKTDEAEFRLEKVMREPFFVPDSKPVDDLLAEFRRQKVHLAIVVDEFGGTDGVVTLEDLLEEIVGDIYDEHDVEEAEIVPLGRGRVRVDGGADLADVIEQFGLGEVEDADAYDTVAGFVIGRLGRIPEKGESVPLGSAELVVTETHDRRVTALEMRLAEREEGRESPVGEE